MRALVVVVALAGACESERYPDARTVTPRVGGQISNQTTRLAAGPERALPDLENPFEGNVHAIQEGQRLYSWFNCAGCHGAIGGGSIGPPLRDRDWIYGGTTAQIYHSIVEGRPQGMPAFRGIPEDSLWKVIAFVRSFGEPPVSPGAPAREPESMHREAEEQEELHGAE